MLLNDIVMINKIYKYLWQRDLKCMEEYREENYIPPIYMFNYWGCYIYFNEIYGVYPMD